tara:strand:- start:1275 stop:1580 length:306 start_codon:yes stop_codon:yes gene_type:complete
MEKSMKLVRLVSGEEIIGDVVENEDGSYTISNAFNLLPGGEGKIQFIPFMAYTEAHNGVTLKAEHVLFSVNPIAQLVEQITNVKRQMDSGIITPDTGIVKP